MSNKTSGNHLTMGFTTAMQLMKNRAEAAEINRKMKATQVQEAIPSIGALPRSETKDLISMEKWPTEYVNKNSHRQQDVFIGRDILSSLRKKDSILSNKPLEIPPLTVSYAKDRGLKPSLTARSKRQESKEQSLTNTETALPQTKTSPSSNKSQQGFKMEQVTDSFVVNTRQLSFDMTKDCEHSSHNETEISPCPTEAYEYWFSPGHPAAEKPNGPSSTSQRSILQSPITRLTRKGQLVGGTGTMGSNAFSSMTLKGRHPSKSSYNFSEATGTTENTQPKEDLLDWMEWRLSSSPPTRNQTSGTNTSDTCQEQRLTPSSEELQNTYLM